MLILVDSFQRKWIHHSFGYFRLVYSCDKLYLSLFGADCHHLFTWLSVRGLVYIALWTIHLVLKWMFLMLSDGSWRTVVLWDWSTVAIISKISLWYGGMTFRVDWGPQFVSLLTLCMPLLQKSICINRVLVECWVVRYYWPLALQLGQETRIWAGASHFFWFYPMRWH